MEELTKLFTEEHRAVLRKKISELNDQVQKLGKYDPNEMMPITASELRNLLKFYSESVESMCLLAEALVKIKTS